MLDDRTILITGGTGSFGKKMVQIILEKYQPHKLIIFSRDELKQFEMSQKWNEKNIHASDTSSAMSEIKRGLFALFMGLTM